MLKVLKHNKNIKKTYQVDFNIRLTLVSCLSTQIKMTVCGLAVYTFFFRSQQTSLTKTLVAAYDYATRQAIRHMTIQRTTTSHTISTTTFHGTDATNDNATMQQSCVQLS